MTTAGGGDRHDPYGVPDPFAVGALGPDLRPGSAGPDARPVGYGGYGGYGGAGGYGSFAPYGAYGAAPVWAAPPRNDPLAVASLVCGIVGLVLLPVLVPQVALVLGIVAARRVTRTGDEGKSMAIAGIVLGGLVTVLTVVLIVFVVMLSTA